MRGQMGDVSEVETVLADLDAKIAEIEAAEKRIAQLEKEVAARARLPVASKKFAHECPACRKLFATHAGMLGHVERKHGDAA